MKNNKKLIVVTLAIVVFSLIVFTVTKYYQNVKSHQVTVYFVKTVNMTKNEIFPVKRLVKVNKMTTAIAELMAGPSTKEQSKGFFTEIPKDTKIIGVKEFSNKYEINLSPEFSSGGGSESMKLRLKQLSYTAIDAAGDKPVYFKLNGKQANFIGGEGLEIPQPLEKDKDN
jgi:spore germination protein GerM